MKGWVKLYRKVYDNEIFADEPFSKRDAFIYMVTLANIDDVTISLDGKPKHLSRGEFHSSIEKLARAWKWDRRKAQRYVDALEQSEMVRTHRTKHGTTFTIVKYDEYQGAQNKRATNDTTNGTTNGTTQPIEKSTRKGNKRATNSTTNGTTDVPQYKKKEIKEKLPGSLPLGGTAGIQEPELGEPDKW